MTWQQKFDWWTVRIGAIVMAIGIATAPIWTAYVAADLRSVLEPCK